MSLCTCLVLKKPRGYCMNKTEKKKKFKKNYFHHFHTLPPYLNSHCTDHNIQLLSRSETPPASLRDFGADCSPETRLSGCCSRASCWQSIPPCQPARQQLGRSSFGHRWASPTLMKPIFINVCICVTDRS